MRETAVSNGTPVGLSASNRRNARHVTLTGKNRLYCPHNQSFGETVKEGGEGCSGDETSLIESRFGSRTPRISGIVETPGGAGEVRAAGDTPVSGSDPLPSERPDSAASTTACPCSLTASCMTR